MGAIIHVRPSVAVGVNCILMDYPMNSFVVEGIFKKNCPSLRGTNEAKRLV